MSFTICLQKDREIKYSNYEKQLLNGKDYSLLVNASGWYSGHVALLTVLPVTFINLVKPYDAFSSLLCFIFWHSLENIPASKNGLSYLEDCWYTVILASQTRHWGII